MNIRKWLMKKLAGDRLVVLNATIFYRYYPIFADLTKDPIIDSCNILKQELETAFQLYDSRVFETVENEVRVKPEYKEGYDSAIEQLKKDADEAEAKKRGQEIIDNETKKKDLSELIEEEKPKDE